MNHQSNSRMRKALARTSDGRIFITGIVMTVLYSLWLIIELILDPVRANVLIGMTVADIFAGRAGAMVLGYAAELTHATVIPVCIAIETILVLLFYPLFVFAWKQLIVIKRLDNIFQHARNAAEFHRPKVERYGFIGLLCFVWMPFWMTGPVVGCVIGFLIGMRTWKNMVAVIGGTCVAVTCWAFFLKTVHEKATSYTPLGSVILVTVFVIIILSGYLLRKRRNHSS